MKNIIKAFSLGLIITFIMSSCSDHTVSPPQFEFANGRVIGTVRGVVSDFTTNVPFDSGSVTITWIDKEKTFSTTCKNLGYYSIDSLSSGEHELTFSGPVTHANSRITVTIPELKDILECCPATNKDYRHSVTENINLYKKSNHVEGRVYYKISDTKTDPAEGVTVVADYRYTMDEYEITESGYNVIPARYTTFTDNSGFFKFDSLPCTPTVVIKTMPYTAEGVEYESYIHQIQLHNNSFNSIGDVVIDPVSAVPIIVQNNFIGVEKFPVSSSFIATFSKKMVPSAFDVTLYKSSTLVETNISCTDSLTLTIDPYADLRPGDTYTLSINGKSIDNNNFSQNYTIHTQSGIEFVSTNLEVSQGIMDKQFPVEKNIEITFSMEVNLSNPNTYIYLKDEDDFYVDFNVSLSGDQKTVVIDPVGNFEYDKSYSISFEIYSSIPDNYVSDTETGLDFTFSTESAVTIPSKVTEFLLDMGSVWNADYNTTIISFKWKTVPGADQYLILAKDNHNNTDYVYLDMFYASDHLLNQTGTVDLSSDANGQFDFYPEDGKITPFCNGNEISFYIAAVNKAGQSVLSDPVTVKDNVAPAMELTQQYSADNTLSNAVTISIDFNGLGTREAEYLDTDNLTISIAETGGDASYVLPLTNITPKWYNNRTGAALYLNIPANTNASGDSLTVNCIDTSGNSSTVSTVLL